MRACHVCDNPFLIDARVCVRMCARMYMMAVHQCVCTCACMRACISVDFSRIHSACHTHTSHTQVHTHTINTNDSPLTQHTHTHLRILCVFSSIRLHACVSAVHIRLLGIRYSFCVHARIHAFLFCIRVRYSVRFDARILWF